MNSSLILIGAGYATWNGGNFRTRGDIKAQFIKKLREVSAEEFGRFDSTQTDRMIKVTMRIWSGYENLSLMLPSAAFSPVPGGKLFGTSNLALIVNGQDGSRLTVVNAQLTKMANMQLAVESELWSADVEFTGLLLSGGSPQTAGDYYTYSISNSYTAPSFTKSNFRAPVLSATWGGTLVNSGTSLAAFVFRKGASIDWKWSLNPEPCYVDGFGTTDMIIGGASEDEPVFEATCKGTPIGAIEADVASAMLPAQAFGLLEGSNGAGDLTLTFGANSIVLKQAFVAAHEGFEWSRSKNRIGDLTWRTTVPFSSGAPTARAAVS